MTFGQRGIDQGYALMRTNLLASASANRRFALVRVITKLLANLLASANLRFARRFALASRFARSFVIAL